MAINRYELVSRHNPILKNIDTSSPLTVGNGEFAYTADITGMQTLYKEYKNDHAPLCTMAQWGWHTTPVSEKKYSYAQDELELTEYEFEGRKVKYAVEKKKGNEEVYDWLRENPHRLNLARIGLTYKNREIAQSELSNINQELNLYTGILKSKFLFSGSECNVKTACNPSTDTVAFSISSKLLCDKGLQVSMIFPYGSPEISASNWDVPNRHESNIIYQEPSKVIIERILDQDIYYVSIEAERDVRFDFVDSHHMIIETTKEDNRLEFTTTFSNEKPTCFVNVEAVFTKSKDYWRGFWEQGGMVQLNKSKDPRALELERRIILSQYLSAIQSCGSIPPQETGLTCNSWYGKFHLEMHLWHCAYLPLWDRQHLLGKSLYWYQTHLNEAKENASKNGYKGARWPKMIAYDAIDSPSIIATLLIWQQPHIIYMLELMYQNNKEHSFLEKYWELVKETADFMVDFAVYNKETGKYDLKAPIIPVQEEHDPTITYNPAFEVEYWRFTLKIAQEWAKRLEIKCCELWNKVADNMAECPIYNNLYIAHENCKDTFENFNRDHPSMLGAYGLIDSDRINTNIMKNTLEKVLECWDFATLWGWDFALMSMSAVRLGDPDTAIDILLKDTPKNSYVVSGNNFQKLRTDLPLYLPGNGGLLLAIAMMTAGYKGCNEALPGFPKNGMWEVEYENISKFPY